MQLPSAYSENIFTGPEWICKNWAAQFNFSDDSCGESWTDLREPAASSWGARLVDEALPWHWVGWWINVVTSPLRSCGKGNKCGSQPLWAFLRKERRFYHGIVWNLAIQIEKKGLGFFCELWTMKILIICVILVVIVCVYLFKIILFLPIQRKVQRK